MIVLTSNIGSLHIQGIEDRAGLERADKKELIRRAILEEVRKAFRPEFVNRLDEIVVFQRLERSQIRQIVDIQLGQFAQRLARRELTLELTDHAKDSLGEAGFDPQYGARPLKRAIQRYLEDALAKRVLAGEFPPGTTIRVDGDASAGFRFEAKVQN